MLWLQQAKGMGGEAKQTEGYEMNGPEKRTLQAC